jgi:hypothetical protein
MTDFAVDVLDVRAEPYAAAPTLMCRVRVVNTSGVGVHVLALRCQIRIEPQRRRYSTEEEEHLLELFGETPQWGDSLKPFLWTHTSAVVQGFVGNTELELPIECTYDFELTAAKYLHALRDGDVPLIFLFSGTAFTQAGEGFTAQPLSWSLEASYPMPVRVWREMMDLYFPNSGWVRVHRDTLDALQRFKATRALPTWEQAFETLLKEAGEDGG